MIGVAPKNPVVEGVLNARGGEVSFPESRAAALGRGVETGEGVGDAKGFGDSLLAKREVLD